MKVFLSSTYLDLIEHRKAVVNALRTMDEDVGNMEVFGARDEEATSVSLAELDKCDVLVGVYAYRYGTVPGGSKVSVTEQEYLHAMSKKIPVLVFVVDESHPWPPKSMDKNLTQVEEFKSKTTKEHTPDYFTSPDNLATKVVASVGRLAKKLSSKSIPDPSSPILYISPKPTGSTLPQQPFFFGRVKELETIADAISPESRTWGALIDGPGGIGKTALAVEAAHRAPKELYERKIFITSKVRELRPEGEKPLTDFTRPDYLSMLNELALELGEDGILRLAPDERTNALRLALADKKALIIFDNLETLHPDERERLFQFLSRLPHGDKAIVTSRRRDNIDARIIRLDRMEKVEALELIENLAQNNNRLARENKEAREKLYEITNGNPLLIKWVCGQLGREGSAMHTIAEACAFIEKAPKNNDPLEYIFGDLLETFTESETKVLAALTYFTQPAKLAWISQMTNMPESAAETALEDLTDRSILIANMEAQEFYLPPLAAQFIKTRRPEVVTQTGDALTQRAYALAMQYGGGNKDYEKFPLLDAEWDFISAALPRLMTGDNNRLQTVCNQLDRFLEFTGRWDNLLWLLIECEARALAGNDQDNAGLRAFQTGWVYQLRYQHTEVLECATRAAEHWQNSTPLNKATAIRLRGLGYKLGKDYPAALSAYSEALAIYRSISPENSYVATILIDIAVVEHEIKDYLAAERDYHEALRIEKKNNYIDGVSACIGWLAQLALDRNKWTEAESLAREALASAEKIGRQELIAWDCHIIAKALLNQKQNIEEALSFSRHAVEIYTYQRHPDLQEVQETLAEIENAMQKAE